MLRKIWKGFVDRFIKTGMWFPALFILAAVFVYYIWDRMIMTYFVFIVFGLFVLYIGARQVYWFLFKKGDYERKSDNNTEGKT